VRDFSINDSTVNGADRGTFMAFTYDGAGPDPNTATSDGMEHLLALKDAGLTHVHLLPAFDIASVPENSVPRTVSPAPTGYARNGEEQQAAVGAARAPLTALTGATTPTTTVHRKAPTAPTRTAWRASWSSGAWCRRSIRMTCVW
jgi:hypothetical protein